MLISNLRNLYSRICATFTRVFAQPPHENLRNHHTSSAHTSSAHAFDISSVCESHMYSIAHLTIPPPIISSLEVSLMRSEPVEQATISTIRVPDLAERSDSDGSDVGTWSLKCGRCRFWKADAVQMVIRKLSVAFPFWCHSRHIAHSRAYRESDLELG